MKWFGKSWGAPVCKDAAKQVPVPVGQRCAFCDRDIEKRDRGFVLPFVGDPTGGGSAVYHLDCLLFSVGVSREVIPTRPQ